MISDWMELGYSQEQSIEIDKASQYGDGMSDITVDEASEDLLKVMEKYEIDYESENVRRIIDKLNQTPNS